MQSYITRNYTSVFRLTMTCLVAVLSIVANAQELEKGIISPTTLGLKPAVNGIYQSNLPAGKVVASSQNVTMSVLFDDAYRSYVTSTTESYNTISVNGDPFFMGEGIQGGVNPTFTKDGAQFGSFGEIGCVYNFDVKNDGYLIVYGRYSYNKMYHALEAVNQHQGRLVAFSFAGATLDNGQKLFAAVPSQGGYLLDDAYSLRYLGYYLAQGFIPEWTYGNAIGALVIPVYKGRSYYVFGKGTRLPVNGYSFIPTFHPSADGTAKIARGITFKKDVAPGVPMKSLNLDRQTATLSVGATLRLNADINPDNATHSRILWSSNNTYAAKVTPSGLVTGVGTGTAVITARSIDGTNLTASCTIEVTPAHE